MRTPVDLIVTAAALKVISGPSSQRVMDAVLEQNQDAQEFKNVCAKVHISLSNRIDEIVTLLGISKRAFLEAAMYEACHKADAIIESEGLFDHISAMSSLEGDGSFIVEA